MSEATHESFPGGTIATPESVQQETAEPTTGKTFTQDELERAVEQRLIRERKRYSDYDELKRAAGELQKVKDANKSDLERAVDAARKEAATEVAQRYNSRVVTAEARALAAAAKFRDPSDAVAFLGDLSSVSVSEDGEVDTKSLSARLTDLAKQKPYLLADEKPTRPSGDAGQGPRTDGPTNMNALLHSLARRA